jgi:AraC-like DNA-binding protein
MSEASVFEWNTDACEGGDRIAHFHAGMDQIRCSVTIEAPSREFSGAYRGRATGCLMIADFVASAARVSRTSRDIAQSSLGSFFLMQQSDPRGSLFRTRMMPETLLRAGDMIVADADEWFQSVSGTGFGHRVWVIPRPLVRHGGDRLAAGLLLSRDHPFTRILRAYLDELACEAGRLDPPALAALTAQIGPLLEVAVEPQRSDELARHSIATSELALLKRRIESRLYDPGFDAPAAASVAGMSLRKLHRLFAASETSFSAYVTARRLEHARFALIDPGQAHRSIAEIAFGNGFNSLATFYRAFRTRYGEAPGDVRRS